MPYANKADNAARSQRVRDRMTPEQKEKARKASRECNARKFAAMTKEEKSAWDEKRRKDYAKNPEKSKEASRKYYHENKKDDPEYRAHMKVYSREYRMKTKFGLTVEQVNEMAEAQGGKCAICCKRPRPKQVAYIESPWHVDHDHKTGKVRGLLCNRCNLMLGHVDDDVTILQTAIEYLNSFRGN